MQKSITEHELQQDCDAILSAVEAGETLVVTRNGLPVGELRPLRRSFVSAEEFLVAFRNAPRIDAEQFRHDVDGILDQDPTPRL